LIGLMMVARASAPLGALLAHGVGYVAGHLGDVNPRSASIGGHGVRRAGERQRGDEDSHPKLRRMLVGSA
jgi:hypothetical protein